MELGGKSLAYGEALALERFGVKHYDQSFMPICMKRERPYVCMGLVSRTVTWKIPLVCLWCQQTIIQNGHTLVRRNSFPGLYTTERAVTRAS